MVNVAAILKQVPKGTKLWSNIFGEVEFGDIDEENVIEVYKNGEEDWFNSDGKLNSSNFPDGECILWPSKDHRAWDDEAYEILGIEKKSEAPFNLQPFDKVLGIRDFCDEVWHADLFSHIDKDLNYRYVCIGWKWKYCIPYNDETKHLLGTNQEPPEKYTSSLW